MNFLDTSLRISHPCPFCDFSASYPDAEMVLWCNGSSEVLQVSVPDPSALREVLREARKALSAHEIVQDGRSALTVLRSCECRKYRSVSVIADECGVWLVPPVTYYGGRETHRVLSKGRPSLQHFIAEVRKSGGTVEVASHKPREHLDVIHDMSVVPIHLFGGLTTRQIRALVLAYENGLLDVPAKTKMDRIATREGISRSTFGEHLRKAQLQLLRNSYPFLKLRDVDVKKD